MSVFIGMGVEIYFNYNKQRSQPIEDSKKKDE